MKKIGNLETAPVNFLILLLDNSLILFDACCQGSPGGT